MNVALKKKQTNKAKLDEQTIIYLLKGYDFRNQRTKNMQTLTKATICMISVVFLEKIK